MKQAKQGRAFPPQDYSALITPEQAATLRARRQGKNSPASELPPGFCRTSETSTYRTMGITHQDRNGKYWRFGINCTPEQADIIIRALAGVRNMGRGALSIKALIEETENAPLFDNIETAILRGLAAAFPYRTPTPPQQVGTGTGRLFPEPEAPADNEPAPRYWWERD